MRLLPPRLLASWPFLSFAHASCGTEVTVRPHEVATYGGSGPLEAAIVARGGAQMAALRVSRP
eukprot:5188976-Pyramimonas_sp.AAC.1